MAPGGHDMEQVSAAAQRSQRVAIALPTGHHLPYIGQQDLTCFFEVQELELELGLRCGCVFPVRLAEPGYADKKCPAAPGVRSVRGPLGEPLFISTPLCISQELVLARESSNNPWLSLNCEAVHCAADSSALSHHSLVHYLTCAARPIVGTYYK